MRDKNRNGRDLALKRIINLRDFDGTIVSKEIQ